MIITLLIPCLLLETIHKYDYFENLIIEVSGAENPRAYVIKYYPYRPLEYFKEHESFKFSGISEISEIQYDSSIFMLEMESGCYLVSLCDWGGSVHVAGPNCTWSHMFLELRCEGGGGGGTGSGTGGTGGSGSGSGSGGSGSGGDSGSSSNTSNPIPLFETVITLPRPYINIILSLSLNLEQVIWINKPAQAVLKSDLIQYLSDNQNSAESKEFAKELINTSMILDINAVKVWNDYDNFRNQMSTSERALFDNLLPNRKLWYACAAKKAFDKANELFPPNVNNNAHNGKGDAFRHALWNGISTLLIGSELAEQLTDAHENKPAPPEDPFNYKEVEMDLYNNNQGRLIAIYSNITNIISNVLQEHQLGFLRYLNNLDSNSLATYNSILIPTDQ